MCLQLTKLGAQHSTALLKAAALTASEYCRMGAVAIVFYRMCAKRTCTAACLGTGSW
jgi:hypothetical protein